ncbi:DNA polymerase III, delta subunit [Geotalea daltonii FRC-32]|uniref:DNA polymerase III subunit delta n=1 Tax=Geotalea daltonii (strain DSM 22248 / JCM 15807 / FRC-32) TaxID=316067 RepID=B9M9F5_GEODF|nr:DNA polymerase III subunit delta [Geotalea daltonii]ACM20527.1 DNA polymerase III, delta subunit [Geotalea daltonii FRC-32]
MKPDEFTRAVDKGSIAPFYYLYGDEPYLIEKGVKRLLDRIVSADFRDFNFNIFYGNECKGEEIFSAAQTLPMFADRRAILVKKSQDLSAAALDVLLTYLQNPSPTTCLIFQGEKIDQRKKFFAEIKKSDCLVEFKRPYENQLGAFIREEIKACGKRIDPAAADLLAYMVGNNLQELASQIEKVVTYCGGRDSILMDDIKAVVSDTKVDTVFELADAVGEKDPTKAMRTLYTILRDGEAPLMLLAMLARHFRQLWRVRELMDRRVSSAEIGKSAGINPYFLKKVMDQARNYRTAELKVIFERLLELDSALKTSGGKPAALLERFTMEVCGK